jgi:copper homeostasis protein CutC
VLEDLRFSDFGLNVDVSDIDNKLRNMADILSTEVDNLISIGSTDLSSMESSVNDIKKIVKDRNMQIRIMNGNV